MNNPSASNINRRQFIQLILIGTIGFWSRELVDPKAASAESTTQSTISPTEFYHLFIGNQLAQQGGHQCITLKSGKVETLNIPANCREETHLTINQATLDGGDAVVILHTLYDPSIDCDASIKSVLATAPLLDGTRDRCQAAYQRIKEGKEVIDIHAQDVLDIVIDGSSELTKHPSGQTIRNLYRLGSQNSRLMILQEQIERTITESNFSEEKKQRLKGLYQYVKANEPLPNSEDLDDLTLIDAMVQSSQLPLALKQRYAIASAQTRAFTADELIISLIQANKDIGEAKQEYLVVYNQVRLGQPVEDLYTLGSLDSFIALSELSSECKAIYKLARNHFFAQSEEAITKDLHEHNLFKSGQQAAKQGSQIIPTLTQIFQIARLTTGTGTTISSLSGAAATNATLATLGGGSVAAGGLGMLGGLAVVTGGAALVGAAVFISSALVAGMDSSDFLNLGIAATTGTAASTVIAGAAWAAVSTFGTAGHLSGAAAISAAMASLGGIGTMTGGAALVAFGVGLGVWQFLKSQDEMSKILRQTEPLLYTIMESSESSLIPIFQEYLNKFRQEIYEIYIAPDIPLDKLANVLFDFASVDRDEKILAIVDMSLFSNGKSGIVFTDRGIWWKYVLDQFSVQYTDSDYLFKIKHLPETTSQDEDHQLYSLAMKLGGHLG